MGNISEVDKVTVDIVKHILPFTDPEHENSGFALAESILAPKPRTANVVVSWHHNTRPMVTWKRFLEGSE